MADSTRTVDDIKTFLQCWKGYDSQQTASFYDVWAKTYEEDSEKINYNAPNLVVNFLNANYPENRGDARVLDVACGSGLVAKLMIECGFKDFVGVDGSKNMLDLATKTGFYRDLRLAVLGTEPLPAETGVYDVVVIVGALRHEHIPISIIRELCNAAKPGGYVCMSRVDPNSELGDRYKESMEAELRLMEEEGLWRRVTTGEMKEYMIDVSNKQEDKFLRGTIYLYRKC